MTRKHAAKATRKLATGRDWTGEDLPPAPRVRGRWAMRACYRTDAPIVRTVGTHEFSESGTIRGGSIILPGTGTREAPNGEEYDHMFVLSSEHLASDGGVLLLDGWTWENYMRRPRFLSMHDIYGWSGGLQDFVLGRAVWVGIQDVDKALVPSGRALCGAYRFSSNPVPQQVKTLYDEGCLTDGSVRWDWRSFDVREPTADEIRKFADESERMGVGLDFIGVSQDLVEYSAVLFGADETAMAFRARVRSAVESLNGGQREFAALRKVLDTADRAAQPDVTRVFMDISNLSDLFVRADEQVDEPAAAGAAPDEVDGGSAVAGGGERGGAAADTVTRDVDQAAVTDGVDAVQRSLDTADAVMAQMTGALQSVRDAATSLLAAATLTPTEQEDEDDRSRADVPDVPDANAPADVRLAAIEEAHDGLARRLDEFAQRVESRLEQLLERDGMGVVGGGEGGEGAESREAPAVGPGGVVDDGAEQVITDLNQFFDVAGG